MNSLDAALRVKDTKAQGDLHGSLGLGDRSWKLCHSDGLLTLSRYSVNAGDHAADLDSLQKVRTRCGLDSRAKVHPCYKAGRDGWWLHRWLREQDIDNFVVNSSTFEPNRRAEQANTDWLDAD